MQRSGLLAPHLQLLGDLHYLRNQGNLMLTAEDSTFTYVFVNGDLCIMVTGNRLRGRLEQESGRWFILSKCILQFTKNNN